ncbi:MAG: hypothetical protein AB7P97_21895 [Hyphomonadaceae bacterium]
MEDILFLLGLTIVAEAALMLVLWSDKQALKKLLQMERENNDILMRYLKPAPRDNVVRLKLRSK